MQKEVRTVLNSNVHLSMKRHHREKSRIVVLVSCWLTWIVC